MRDRSAKIVDQKLEDRLDLIFRVPRVVGKRCILNRSTQPHYCPEDLSTLHTHSPFPSIIRARNIEAAAM